MKEFNRRLGKLMRKLRQEKGLTQEDLADKADLHPKHFGIIERGEVDIRITNLLKITNALEIDLSDFFKGLPSKFGPKEFPLIYEWHALVEDADDETVENLIALAREILKRFG